MKTLLITLFALMSFNTYAALGEDSQANCLSGNQAGRFQEDVRAPQGDSTDPRPAGQSTSV